MACDAPRLECLSMHILPRLPDGTRLVKDAHGTITGLRTFCPAHADKEPSLSISIGDEQRNIRNCFARCDPIRVRAALIEVYRIDPGCLPVGRKEEAGLIAAVEAILTSPSTEDALVRLRALARLRGYRELPKGAALLGLAAEVGMGRSQAFDYARRSRTSTRNPVQYPSAQDHPEHPTSRRRVASPEKSGKPDSVRKTGLAEVRKPGPQKSGNSDSRDAA